VTSNARSFSAAGDGRSQPSCRARKVFRDIMLRVKFGTGSNGDAASRVSTLTLPLLSLRLDSRRAVRRRRAVRGACSIACGFFGAFWRISARFWRFSSIPWLCRQSMKAFSAAVLSQACGRYGCSRPCGRRNAEPRVELVCGRPRQVINRLRTARRAARSSLFARVIIFSTDGRTALP